MRLGLVPENWLERIALMLGWVPEPLLYTMNAPLLARSVMVATESGLFDILGNEELEAGEVAERCGSHPVATEKLMGALTRSRLLRFRRGRYRISRSAKRWLLRDSPESLYDMVIFCSMCLRHLDHLEEYLRSGKPLDIHETENDPAVWAAYQKGMRAMASLSAPEVGERTPVPDGATQMLDIGGSHGLYSVAICRRHPRLSAVVLDLPAAVEHAAPILAEEGMGERVRHEAGDVLQVDLGEDQYDLVLISQLVHHFPEAENRELMRRIERALRPGGKLVIQGITKPPDSATNQLAGLLDLFFALTSRAGSWTFEEIASWQRDAGLTPRKPMMLRTMPGGGQQVATK